MQSILSLIFIIGSEKLLSHSWNGYCGNGVDFDFINIIGSDG